MSIFIYLNECSIILTPLFYLPGFECQSCYRNSRPPESLGECKSPLIPLPSQSGLYSRTLELTGLLILLIFPFPSRGNSRANETLPLGLLHYFTSSSKTDIAINHFDHAIINVDFKSEREQISKTTT